MQNRTNIILVGAAGRMGAEIIRTIEDSPDFALDCAVESSSRIASLQDLHCPVTDDLAPLLKKEKSAVLVDFTNADAALKTAHCAAESKTPLVIGATGFSKAQKDELETLARECPIFLSGNMSIGVNVLIKFLPLLASALGTDYDIEILEIHHGKKKDAPSGTALMIGEALASARNWEFEKCKNFCRDEKGEERPKIQIGFQSIRGGDVAGVHTIYFLGGGERIEVTHQAHSRQNFARGALAAAKWISAQKPGKLYSMQDMLTEADNAEINQS